MVPGIHNFSEIGKLNKVLLHRIGHEIDGLVPDNFARLLFDDIPYLKVAQQEHDAFADLLRENGVEVVYYVDELTKALHTKKLKEAFIRDFIVESDVSSKTVAEALFSYLSEMPTREMVENVIRGVRKREVPAFESPQFRAHASAAASTSIT